MNRHSFFRENLKFHEGPFSGFQQKTQHSLNIEPLRLSMYCSDVMQLSKKW
jgi:hypothetical protein